MSGVPRGGCPGHPDHPVARSGRERGSVHAVLLPLPDGRDDECPGPSKGGVEREVL